MDCNVTRDWLLQAERPGDAPAAVAGHVRGCPRCAALAERLVRLEAHYRAEALPADVLFGRDAFLRRLAATPAQPARTLAPAPRWAVAALMLLAFGLGSLLVLPGTPAQATVVGRLIDWNVNLADAGARDDAVRRFTAAEPGLTADLARQPAGERELAESLLDHGRWLAAHDDPVETAARMHDVADRLFDRMRKAAGRGDARQSQQFARLYQRVTERGLDPNLDRAAALATLTPEQTRRLDRLERKAAERHLALVALLESLPEPSKRPFRKAPDGRKKPKAKPPAAPPAADPNESLKQP